MICEFWSREWLSPYARDTRGVAPPISRSLGEFSSKRFYFQKNEVTLLWREVSTRKVACREIPGFSGKSLANEYLAFQERKHELHKKLERESLKKSRFMLNPSGGYKLSRKNKKVIFKKKYRNRIGRMLLLFYINLQMALLGMVLAESKGQDIVNDIHDRRL